MRSLWQLLHDANGHFEADIQRFENLVDIAHQLNIGISLERSQELYFHCLHNYIIPGCTDALASDRDTMQYRQLLNVGEKLGVCVSPWLNQF